MERFSSSKSFSYLYDRFLKTNNKLKKTKSIPPETLRAIIIIDWFERVLSLISVEIKKVLWKYSEMEVMLLVVLIVELYLDGVWVLPEIEVNIVVAKIVDGFKIFVDEYSFNEEV